MHDHPISGSESLALGALEAGVQFVTGYPGSPSTATVEALLQLTRGTSLSTDSVPMRIEWAINEKSAFDTALGASLAGVRSLVCLKSVGLNVALDGLMVANLAPGEGGLVVLVGDDPSGWGSQNEEDARPLVAAAEIPMLEPCTSAQARIVMSQAFSLSERFRVPAVVRFTRALAQDRMIPDKRAEVTTHGASGLKPEAHYSAPPISRVTRQADRYNVLPIHVVEYHKQLQAKIRHVQAEFENWPGNLETATYAKESLRGDSDKTTIGVLAGGHMAHKLDLVLAQNEPPPMRLLRLSTLYPLPEARIRAFLAPLDRALILEEIAPYLEVRVQAIAQRAGLIMPILGRTSGHLPGAGELFPPEISAALAGLRPDWPWPVAEPVNRTMPSRQPLCDECPYIPMLEALLAVMARRGGRDAFVITGETGCIVRAQLPPWELLDIKYAMGSSIGLAAGLARAGIPQRIIAISGDSALLHSGMGELIDAVQAGIRLLVIILANETTALSGGQPHPATGHNAEGLPRPAVDLAALIRAAGVNLVRIVDPQDTAATQAAFDEGLDSGQLAVMISQRACPKWETIPSA
jgi:indolepyruvate ferredoxin oxidoreductase alpha subunit